MLLPMLPRAIYAERNASLKGQALGILFQIVFPILLLVLGGGEGGCYASDVGRSETTEGLLVQD